MEMISAIIAEKLIFFSVNNEISFFDAVAETTYERTEITAVVFIPGDIVLT